MDLKGKGVLLTGAARMGAAVVGALVARGAKVAVVYRSTKPKAGLPVRADLSKPEEIARAVAEARKAFGRLDAIVHMASPYATAELGDFAAFEESWRVEALGGYRLVMAAV